MYRYIITSTSGIVILLTLCVSGSFNGKYIYSSVICNNVQVICILKHMFVEFTCH